MKNSILILILALFIWLNESCQKVKINNQGFADCYDSQTYDSAKVASDLVGSWNWTKQSCFWTGTTIKADKYVKITFTTSGSFSVTENSIVVTEGNWKLKLVANETYELDLSDYSEYLWGVILLCRDDILFYNSNVDGCDNLFERM